MELSFLSSIPKTPWGVVLVGAAGTVLVLLPVLVVLTRRAAGKGEDRVRPELKRLRTELAELDATLREREEELQTARIDLARREESLARVPELADRLRGATAELGELRKENRDLAARLVESETRAEEQEAQATERIELLTEARDRLKVEFRSLADRIFEEKSERFVRENRERVDEVLSPIREQLREFRTRVDTVYDRESRDRQALKTEIDLLKSLNERIGRDALNLTKALKGQTRTQGVWGEMVLERILTQSGLERGLEYEVQAVTRNEDGRKCIPDVIVRLPDDRAVIVDSKVSLTAYERSVAAETDGDRTGALRAHVKSVRAHVLGLAAKKYETVVGAHTLDFVLLFIPVEPAYLAAVREDPELFQEAYDRNIILVCPSTLMMSLRTIQNIWRYEHQSRNAREIATRAAGLYDRFVNFTASLEEVGRHLDKARNSYATARKRLVSGRGNLVRTVESFRELGVAPRKTMGQSLREGTEDGEHCASGKDTGHVQ